MAEGGVLTLEITAEANSVRLAVSDTGCGMDELTREHAFEPFYTTKPLGVGTGLGLSTVYGIVIQSGGDITLLSTPNAGTSFIISLPRIEAPELAGVVENTDRRETGSETVLVVEDEDRVRAMAVRILRAAGFIVREATEGEEGLRILKQEEGRVDVLLSDIVMPRMSGVELARQALELDPSLAVVLTSGYVHGTKTFGRKRQQFGNGLDIPVGKPDFNMTEIGG